MSIKKTTLSFFITLVSVFAFFTEIKAQRETDGIKPPEEDVFTVVETMPEFPGGEDALYDFITKNIQYPAAARDMGIQGKVWLSFIILKDGSVTEVEVLRGIGGGCDEEALRVIKMMPKWIPGKQAGQPIKVKFRFPISFMLK